MTNHKQAENITAKRHKFLSRKQEENETLDSFIAVLIDLSRMCQLGRLRDELLKDVMICNLSQSYKKVQKVLILENPTTLEEAVCFAKKLLEPCVEGIGADDRKENYQGKKLEAESKEETHAETDKEKPSFEIEVLQPSQFNSETKPGTDENDQVLSELDFRRPACSLPFKDQKTLDVHREIHSKRFTCKICGVALKKMNSLNRHMQSHSGERPFMCSECGKCFIRKGALDAHLSTHNKVRPYICNYCNKAFANKLYLFVHIRIHTGDKPYQCQFCGKCFAQKSTFNVHVRTNHTKETPYKCSHCDKAFVYKRELDDHTLSHSGDTPFLCPECGKSFTRQSYLNVHRKIHSDERPHECEICEKSFKSKKHLNRHSSMHCDKNNKSLNNGKLERLAKLII